MKTVVALGLLFLLLGSVLSLRHNLQANEKMWNNEMMLDDDYDMEEGNCYGRHQVFYANSYGEDGKTCCSGGRITRREGNKNKYICL